VVSTAHTYKLSAYPRKSLLRDKTEVVFRPMTPADAPALQAFFQRVPAKDRFYLKEDVTSPKIIDRWAKELDYDRALPILAFVGNRVVADGTLHRQRAGARRHIGEIRAVVDPEFRNRGLGTRLFQELLEIAHENDLERVTIELVADEEDAAIKAANWVGFSRVGTMPNFVRDSTGHPHDLVVMEMLMSRWYEWGRQEPEQF